MLGIEELFYIIGCLIFAVIIFSLWDIFRMFIAGFIHCKPQTRTIKVIYCILGVALFLIIYISTWKDAESGYARLKNYPDLKAKVPALPYPDLELKLSEDSSDHDDPNHSNQYRNLIGMSSLGQESKQSDISIKYDIIHHKYLVILYAGDIVPYIFDSYIIQWPEEKNKLFHKEYTFPDGKMTTDFVMKNLQSFQTKNLEITTSGLIDFHSILSLGKHTSEITMKHSSPRVRLLDDGLFTFFGFWGSYPFSIRYSCGDAQPIYLKVVPIHEEDPLKEINASDFQNVNCNYQTLEQRGDKMLCVASSKLASATVEIKSAYFRCGSIFQGFSLGRKSMLLGLLVYFAISFLTILVSVLLLTQLFPAKPVSFALLLTIGVMYLVALDHSVLQYHLSIAQNPDKSLDERLLAWKETTKTFFYRDSVVNITDLLLSEFEKYPQKYPAEIQKVIKEVNRNMPSWHYAMFLDHKFPLFYEISKNNVKLGMIR